MPRGMPLTPPTATNSAQPDIASASIAEVIDAFHSVRISIAELLDAVGADPTKTRESARLLGLNRGLTWRLTRVVRDGDVSSVVSDVPGRQSMGKFIAACRERGAPEPSLAEAARAFDAFESAVDACSGDRKTLAMLMANRGDRDSAADLERSRRRLFDGACSYWGVQAQVRFVSVFVFPSKDDPAMLDAGHVTGYVGFRRLGARAWPLAYETVHRASGEVQQLRKSPLDPSGASEAERQLMREFCKPESPAIEAVICGGEKRFELAAGPVGNEGLTTCVFGSYLHRIYERWPDEPDTAGFLVRLQTPVERLIFDMFVHKDLGVVEPPPVQLLDRMTYPHAHIENEFDRQALPLAERAEMIPGGAGRVVTPSIPWYPRLLQRVSEIVAHPLDAFHASRFEMTYPPISTTCSRRFPLPTA